MCKTPWEESLERTSQDQLNRNIDELTKMGLIDHERSLGKGVRFHSSRRKSLAPKKKKVFRR
jgi:hypothetical protein